jgi:hypothetical protein
MTVNMSSVQYCAISKIKLKLPQYLLGIHPNYCEGHKAYVGAFINLLVNAYKDVFVRMRKF